jgi:hypothetical protein
MGKYWDRQRRSVSRISCSWIFLDLTFFWHEARSCDRISAYSAYFSLNVTGVNSVRLSSDVPLIVEHLSWKSRKLLPPFGPRRFKMVPEQANLLPKHINNITYPDYSISWKLYPLFNRHSWHRCEIFIFTILTGFAAVQRVKWQLGIKLMTEEVTNSETTCFLNFLIFN